MRIVHPEHDQSGKRVTVMGLGLHGGGAAAARYFADRGAQVTITDLRDEETLRPSLEVLSSDRLRYVLGRHEERDFTHADVIVKNPAVPRNSPYIITALQHGAALETDISIFLSFLCNLSLQGRQGVQGEQGVRGNREPADRHAPELGNVVFIAVTGSKGKSSTSTIIHHILSLEGDKSAAYLGGNITVSPLSFLEDIPQAIARGKTVYIVLELSSFQIGDLRQVIDSRHAQHELYWPDYAILTTILPDHQDYYHNMEDYVRDKLYLFENMPYENIRIIGDAGKWMSLFLRSGESIAAADIKNPKMTDTGKNFRIMGEHLRTNINMAIHLLRIMGIGAEQINRGVENFPGIDHRLQEIGACMEGRMRIINDSAATIPEACLQAVRTFDNVYLICGGADKNLLLDRIVDAGRYCRKLYLLEGSASSKLIALFEKNELPFKGLFSTMEDAVRNAYDDARARALRDDSSVVILLSPGCASFGMFQNEFDRGRKFIQAAQRLPEFSSIRY